MSRVTTAFNSPLQTLVTLIIGLWLGNTLFCNGLVIPSTTTFRNNGIAKSKRNSNSKTALSLASTSPLFQSSNNNKHNQKSSTALFVATNVTTVSDISSSKDSESLSKNQEALSNRKWPRTWVPLASVYELDPNRPTPLEFLDQKFVCYKQTSDDATKDDWIVMDDVCPHRLVPLSEGRINRVESNSNSTTSCTTTTTTTTTIQCSYHGWEFDGSQNGACAKIPQATPELEANAIKVPRASVQTYSTRVHKNILWFWPWQDTDALSLLQVYPKGHPEGIMASIANLPLDDEEEGMESNPSTYTRDLPYGWDTLLENLIDPAHIPFAHHGLQGTREDAIPIQMSVPHTLGSFQDDDSKKTNLRSGEAGFLFEWQDRTMGKHRAGTAEFQAPFGIAYEGKYYSTREDADAVWGTHCDEKRKMLNGETIQPKSDDENGEKPKNNGLFTLGVLCIPTKPGWSRAIILTGGQAKEKKLKEKAKALTQSKTEEEESNEVATVDEASKPTTTKKKKKKKSLISIIFGIIPTWALHLLSNKFLDSDLAFLHYQEQERLRYEASSNSGSGSSSFYYMPAPADRCISKLRQWIPKHTDYLGSANANANAKNGGHFYSLPPPIVNRNQLFDRYLQHTSHCKHCQEGLKFLRTKARKYAWGGLLGSVVASHLLGSRLWGLFAKLFGIACLGALGLVSSLEKAFLVGDFKHYEND